MNSVYCGECSAPNLAKNKFCTACRNPLTVANQPAKERPVAYSSVHNVVCPQCQRDDKIQKLSSIVASGTRRTAGTSATKGSSNFYNRDSNFVGDSFSASRTTVNAVDSTDLAQLVAPPIEPVAPQAKRGRNFTEEEGTSKVAMGLAIGAGLSVAFLIALTNGSNGTSNSSNLTIGCCATTIIVYLGMLIISGNMSKSKDAKWAEEYQVKLPAYNKELERWEKAHERWQTMYYCYKDDVVFAPRERTVVPPNRTVDLAYQER